MTRESSPKDGSFTLSAWGTDGIASFEAIGGDRRTALEAALQATMTLIAGMSRSTAGDIIQSAPIRGEGDDLGLLLTDLLDDLSDQLAYFGAGWHDLSLDGIVKRDDGGLMAWGYVSGAPQSAAAALPIRLLGAPTVDEVSLRRVVIRAELTREERD